MPNPAAPRQPHRIAKLLARAGIASRREVERMIADGRVAVDGTVIDTPATLLASLHGVTVDGNPVQAAAPARLFLYHKPAGLLVTERDPGGRPTIHDKLPADLPRLVPVGRLDLNTEGLLLLTTDGELKRQLELPATGVERAYRARAYGQVGQAQLEDLIEGVEIEGVRYGSINANLERRTGANVWIEMILTEGKNREVRRVLEHLGLRVSRLIRTRYGPFVLGDLPVGGVGEVRQHDLVAFRKNPTRNPPPEHRDLQRGERSSPATRAAVRTPRPVSVTTAPGRTVRTPAAAALVKGSDDPRAPARRRAPAPRIDRAAAAAADRAAFTDVRPTRGADAKRAGWSPRDSRPAEERAARPAAGVVKPRRFYDAKPRRDGSEAPASHAAPARPSQPRGGKPGGGKPRPPGTRPPGTRK